VGEFAASLAHEVRNPLTSIRVDLQRIEEALPEDSETRDLLQRALSQVERLDHSVSGALRVARSGHIESEPVDLRESLRAAAHEAEPAFARSGGLLEPLELGSDPLWVSGNLAALEQLFLNLLLNAAEALEGSGRAGIEVQQVRAGVRICVWDRGRGIAPEDLDRVFDPFYSTRPEGTGLGLAIAQRIAAAHGAELLIESSPGSGTQVALVLARAEGPTSDGPGQVARVERPDGAT
jgi:two-component system sensor histidine kinase HydH